MTQKSDDLCLFKFSWDGGIRTYFQTMAQH